MTSHIIFCTCSGSTFHARMASLTILVRQRQPALHEVGGCRPKRSRQLLHCSQRGVHATHTLAREAEAGGADRKR